MQPAGDTEGDARKRDPRDFALWKAAQAGRAGDRVVADAVGTRPAGLAPGVLGDGDASTSGPTFDIHGGGLDLVFPHHENELAQSRGGRRRLRPVLDAQRPG